MKLKSVLSIAIIAASLALTSCASKPKKPELDTVNADSKVKDDGKNAGLSFEVNGDSDSNKAGSLRTVYFDFNSAALSAETKNALNNNVKFLKENPTVKIQVEGHCDERGSVQFNLALGEKRAKGVKEFLVAQGVQGDRVTTVSLGKEKAVAFGHDEESWSKNRRANFVVSAK
jgi:peptidoglycan-associated lipoprotein